MFVVISGTNRPGNLTVKLARLVTRGLERAGAAVHLVDLEALPVSLYAPESYATKPPELAAHQAAILAATGIVTVVPEYNGSFPGALKYFIDMLEFPRSLMLKPAAFVGLSAGQWGALRGVEQLEMVFQYRRAHLYGERCFVNQVREALDEAGELKDPALRARLDAMLTGFVAFSRCLTAA